MRNRCALAASLLPVLAGALCGPGEAPLTFTTPLATNALPGAPHTVTAPTIGPATVLNATVDGVSVSTAWDGSDLVLSFLSSQPAWPQTGVVVFVRVEDGLNTHCGLDVVFAGMAASGSQTELHGMPDTFATKSAESLCVGDVDNDNDLDVYVSSFSGDNFLLINDGTGMFADEADERGLINHLNFVSEGESCAFGDSDNDGDMDLFVGTFFSGVAPMVNNGAGVFTQAQPFLGFLAQHLQLLDVNGDGFLDVVFAGSDNSGASNLVASLIGYGNGTFSEDVSVLVSPPGNPDFSFFGIATIPIGSGSSPDVAVYSTDGGCMLLWAGDGWVERTDTGFAPPGSMGKTMSAGDFDGDGDFDIATLSDALGLFQNDGSGFFTLTAVSGSSEISLVGGDLDMDGVLDMITAGDGGDVQVWSFSAAGFTDVGPGLGYSLLPEEESLATTVADFDGDSDPELLFFSSHGYIESNLGNAAGARYLVVRPLNGAVAMSAFGAVVQVTCVAGCPAPFTTVRLPGGASTFRCSNPYDVLVAVPHPLASYNVSVTWPFGGYVADGRTHRRLAGIVPAELSTPAERLFVVRRLNLTATLLAPGAWAGVSRPAPGDVVAIHVAVGPGDVALNVTAATVNGVEAGAQPTVGGFDLLYMTPPMDTTWPWSGLAVDVVVEDDGGLYVSSSAQFFPGVKGALRSAAAAGTMREVCAGDVDGDGYPDLFATSGSPALLLLNAGGLGFIDATSAYGLEGVANTVGCAWADVDGDGALDLAVGTDAGWSSQVYIQEGATFRAVAVDGTIASRCMLAGDLNGDAAVDFFECSSVGNSRVLANDGSGGFSVTTVLATAAMGALLDATGDDFSDVFVCDAGSECTLLVNSGEAAFSADPGSHVESTVQLINVASVAVEDVDNNGLIDVFLSRPGAVDVLLLQSTSHVLEAVADAVAGAGGLPRAALLDFDLNGVLDLLAAGSPASLWWQVPSTPFEAVAETFGVEGATETTGVLPVDVDNDGDLDAVFLPRLTVLENRMATPGVSNALVFHLVSVDGAPGVPGASVALECVVGCGTPFAAARLASTAATVFGIHADNRNATFSAFVVLPGGGVLGPGTGYPNLAAIHPPSSPSVVVRAAPVRVSLHALPLTVPPAPATIVLTTSPPATDLALSLSVNGVPAAAHHTGAGRYTASYSSGTTWPWAGLAVIGTATDAAGLVTAVDTTLTPGVEFTPSSAVTTSSASALCAGDVDGDGSVDLFAVGPPSSDHARSLYISTGGGGFTDATTLWAVNGTSSSAPPQCVVADFDGDGSADVLSDSLWLQVGDALQGTGSLFTGVNATGVAVGRLGTSGALDFVVATSLALVPAVLFLNTGSGSFASSPFSDDARLTAASAVSVVDLAANGSHGVVLAHAGYVDLFLKAAPELPFGRAATVALWASDVVTTMLHADVDGNGVVDTVLGLQAGGALVVNGSTFTLSARVSGGLGVAAALNVDGDADLDVVSCSAVLLSTGTTLLPSESLYGLPPTPCPAVAADFDSDGVTDVFTNGQLFSGAASSLESPLAPMSIRPLTARGAPATGDTVVVRCVAACPSPFTALRSIGGGAPPVARFLVDPSAVYNATVHGLAAATHASHPGLGSIHPVSAPALDFVVRVAPPAVSFSPLLPWLGGDTVPLSMQVQGADAFFVSDFVLQSAAANGGPVSVSGVTRDVVTLEYNATAQGDAVWPWEGITVEVVWEDLAGLRVAVNDTLAAPRSGFTGDASRTLTVGDGTGLCAGDADGNSLPDLYVVGTAASALLLNHASGLAAADWGATAGFPGAKACSWADFDDDGALDLLVVAANPVVFLASGPTLTPASSSLPGFEGGLVGDYDGDGHVDIFTYGVSREPAVLFGRGDGGFEVQPLPGGVATIQDAVAVSLSGGSNMDIVTISPGNAVFENGGDRAFTRSVTTLNTFHSISGAGAVAVGLITASFDVALYVLVPGGLDQVCFQGTTCFVVPDTTAGTGVASLDYDLDTHPNVLLWGSAGAAVLHMDVQDDVTRLHQGVDFGLPSTATSALVAYDADGDGDVDVSTLSPTLPTVTTHTNLNAPPHLTSILTVWVWSGAGAPPPTGSATVRVSSTSTPWFARRTVGASAAVPVAVEDPDGTYFVAVAFSGSITHAPKSAYRPGVTVSVFNTPVVVSPRLNATAPVGFGRRVMVMFDVLGGVAPFIPAPGCCFVNGAQTRDTFSHVGNRTYGVVYALQGGEAAWATDSLPVVLDVQSAALSMSTAFHLRAAGPAADLHIPESVFTCDPPAAVSAVRVPQLCVACSAPVCTFSYTVVVNSVRGPPTAAPNTVPNATVFQVGAHAHADAVTVEVVAASAGGNLSPVLSTAWVVDTEVPEVEFRSVPEDPTADSFATLTMACSEPVCRFQYTLDGGPLTTLGAAANGTGVDAEGVMVDTLLLAAPDRVTNTSTPVFVFGFNVSDVGLVVNATVQVSLGRESWVVAVHGGAAGPFTLPAVPDGTYALTARGVAGDGAPDVTPLTYVFEVDTAPPAVAVLAAPGDGDTRLEATMAFASNEADAVFEWRLGGGGWVPTPTGVLLIPAPPGETQTVTMRATDDAANVGAEVVHSWTPLACEGAAPAVTLDGGTVVGPGGRFVRIFSADWPHGYEYSVGSDVWAPTHGDTLTLTTPHASVAVRAVVPTRCVGRTKLSGAVNHTWPAVASPPVTVSLASAPPLSTPDVFAQFVFQASASGALLEYQVDGVEDWTPCGEVLTVGPLTAGAHVLDVRSPGGGGVTQHTWVITAASDSSVVLSGLPDGRHVVEVEGVDAAGLASAPIVHRWRVDLNRPLAVAERLSPQFTTSRQVVIRVACDGEADACTACWSAAPSADVPDGCSSNGTLTLTAGADGEHHVDVTAVDSVGRESEAPARVVWTVDATAPSSRVQLGGGALSPPVGVWEGAVEAFVASSTLTLNATADEPVSVFNVRVNGTVVAIPGNTSLLEVAGLADGVVEVEVWAVDLAGNEEAPPYHQLTALVDGSAPDTRLLSQPPSPSSNGNVTVGVAAADPPGASDMAGIRVSLSGHATREVFLGGSAGNATFEGLASGEYQVAAAGLDAAGNEDPTPATVVVVVDLVPPVSAFASPPAPIQGADVVLLTVVEALTVTSGRRVGGPWVAADADGRVTIAGVLDGTHTFQLRGVDAAGNVEQPPYVEANVTVDTLAPVVTVLSPPPPFTNGHRVEFCAVAADSTTAEFSVNDTRVEVAPTGALSACFAGDFVDDGRHGLLVTAVDAVGLSAPPVEVAWVLDTVPPSVSVTPLATLSTQCVTEAGTTVCGSVSGARIEAVCVGEVAGVSPCSPQHRVLTLAEGTTTACEPLARRLSAADFQDSPAGVFPLAVGGDGLYEVTVRAADAAGNTQAENTTFTWFVDTTPPAASPTLETTPPKVGSQLSALFFMRLEGDASPGQTRFVYTLDDGLETVVPDAPVDNTATVPLSLSVAAGGHLLTVWAVDQGGNPGAATLYDWTVLDVAPDVVILGQPAVVSGDSAPEFQFVTAWPAEVETRSGNETAASIEVDIGTAAGLVTACVDTEATNGLCTWTAPLTESGGPGRYTLTVRAAFEGVFGDPTTYAWEYRVCSDGEYAVLGADLGIECAGCPVGGNCAGGLTTQGDLVARQGFWAPEGSSGLRFYECPVEEACLPGGVVVDGNTTLSFLARCGVGYTGTLCAVCEDSFFEQFGLCVSCDTGSGVAWLITAGVLVAIVAAGAVFFKFREVMPIDQLKVTLSMVQIIASANTAYAIPWPTLFADFLNAMRVFLIEAVSLTRANCAQPMTFYGSLVVTLVAFKVVLAVVVLGPVAVYKCRHRRDAPLRSPQPTPGRRRGSALAHAVHRVQAVDWAKIFKITFLFLFVAYPGVSLKIMKTFKCVEVEGEHWLVADMRLRCYEGDWFGYALYAFVMGCLYTGGLPLAIVVILWRNRRRLGEGGVVAKWGFLYESYGVGAYLWEACELLRKLWLSALVVLMEEGSPLQVTVAVLISGWAHVLHAVYKPWRGVGDGGTYVYALQHGSLFVTFFVFLMGLLFKVEGVSQGGTVYNVLAWAMMLACVGFLVAAVALLTKAMAARLSAGRRANAVTGVKQQSPAKATMMPHPERKDSVPVDRERLGAEPVPIRGWQTNPLRLHLQLQRAGADV